MTSLAQYDAARAALAAATRIDEVLPLREQMAHLKLHARHVQDRLLLADATEIQLRAERKLGFLLLEAEKGGLLRVGRPKKAAENTTPPVGFTLKEIGVTHKLSAGAQKKASISEQAVEAMIGRMRERILSGGATVIDVVAKSQEKKERRAEREQDLARKQQALPDKRYGVILADPEWKHVPWSDQGMLKAADNHYPTTGTDEICARPVETIAADDCVLFLWGTVPMLPDALRVMAAWGFTYRSHVVWRKVYPGKQQGMGYWFRVNHELLLVGTRGNIPCPAPGDNWGSVIDAETRGHSIKPDWQYELIESYFPNLPKIELNARRARPGWDAWGYEAPEQNPAANGSESEGMKQPAEESAGADAGMKPLPCRLADGRTSDSCSSEIDGQAEAASAVSATQFDPSTGEILEQEDLPIPECLRREAGAAV
jgi:N6-adenosine-specific RNA methylase IME4